MKLKTLSALCLAASSMVAASSAMAWESEDGAWSTSANVALSTEYVWRGMTQTDSEPALSGGFDVSHSSGMYFGTWASNVDYGDEASLEIDYYVGFAGDFGDSGFSYDVGGLYYEFPDEDYDAFEVYGFVSYSFLSAGISYSIDAFDADDQEDNVYYQLDASHDVGAISLAAGIGYWDLDDSAAEDLTNWYVGASTEFAGFGLDLTYHDTDAAGNDESVVFSISKSM
jgi:uncharacterized protein (TIGR02001 family)